MGVGLLVGPFPMPNLEEKRKKQKEKQKVAKVKASRTVTPPPLVGKTPCLALSLDKGQERLGGQGR